MRRLALLFSSLRQLGAPEGGRGGGKRLVARGSTPCRHLHPPLVCLPLVAGAGNRLVSGVAPLLVSPCDVCRPAPLPRAAGVLDWGGKLFAFHESGWPHELDPRSLDTKGLSDLFGSFKDPKTPVSAHFKARRQHLTLPTWDTGLLSLALPLLLPLVSAAARHLPAPPPPRPRTSLVTHRSMPTGASSRWSAIHPPAAGSWWTLHPRSGAWTALLILSRWTTLGPPSVGTRSCSPGPPLVSSTTLL